MCVAAVRNDMKIFTFGVLGRECVHYFLDACILLFVGCVWPTYKKNTITTTTTKFENKKERIEKIRMTATQHNEWG